MRQLYILSYYPHVLSSTDMQIPRFSVIYRHVLCVYVMGRGKWGNGNVSFISPP